MILKHHELYSEVKTYYHQAQWLNARMLTLCDTWKGIWIRDELTGLYQL